MKKRTIAWWTYGGLLFGVTAGFSWGGCLCSIPGLPGYLLASTLGLGSSSDPLVSCATGGRLDMLVPANAVVYTVVGAMIGLLIAFCRRERSGPPRCGKCGCLLVGNTSGVCPECGTPVGQSGRNADDHGGPGERPTNDGRS